MRVGIVCGVSASSIKKAKIYQEAIYAVGHTPIVFTRAPKTDFLEGLVFSANTVGGLIFYAESQVCDLYITCNDSLSELVARFNSNVGWPTLDGKAHFKDNLQNLSTEISTPKTVRWDDLDSLHQDVEIFIKPVSGSGTSAFHSWAYKKFASVKVFRQYLKDESLEGDWDHANKSPGLLGEYVVQEFVDNKCYEYIQALNDGVAKTWFTATVNPAVNTFHVAAKLDFSAKDYGLLKNVLPGNFSGFQYFGGFEKPLVFDFNTRYGSHWTYLYPHIFPNFFYTFFNNLLNKKQDRYNPKYNEFQIVLNDTGVKSSNNSIFVFAEDFPFGGLKAVSEIILGES